MVTSRDDVSRGTERLGLYLWQPGCGAALYKSSEQGLAFRVFTLPLPASYWGMSFVS